MDLPCSTLTNMTLMGVKEPMLFAKFFVFQKRFSISANANLKDFQECSFFRNIRLGLKISVCPSP